MNRAQRHRGPDGNGIWRNGSVGLAHCRLSIIDLTESGAQPMTSHSGRFIVTFNGEIYNFASLRSELERHGILFRGTSDTEVLLEAHELWGPSCLSRLEGMFALAIYDTVSSELFLARDRFGKKPLHYAHSGTEFIFASEIKGVLAAGNVSGNWDACAVSDYLSLGYILTPRTIYEQIRRLPAGCYAILRDGRLSIASYWALLSTFQSKVSLSEADRTSEFLAKFDEAVDCRRVADVPLGSFLSGGIDSSSVVASMRSKTTDPFYTFSIAFDNPSYDESTYAREVAVQLGTRHIDQTVDPCDPALPSQLVDVFDEPFADTSAIPMWHLARLARRYVTVALSGDGADEILAGYSTYKADSLFGTYRLAPQSVRGLLGAWALKLGHSAHHKVGYDYRLRQFLIAGVSDARDAHSRWRELFPSEAKDRIMTREMQRKAKGYDPYDTFRSYFREARDLDFLDACLYVDTKTWLQDDILVKVDRTTMAHSLEARAPFLDSRLVSWASSLPTADKYARGLGKVILRRSMEARVPKFVIDRSKSGFNAPTDGIALDIHLDNGVITHEANGECRTEFQRYCLVVLALHLAKLCGSSVRTEGLCAGGVCS